jgi:hypothetical protein
MINWLRKLLAPDEVYVVSHEEIPQEAHTTYQGATEATAGASGLWTIIAVPLVID